jgi:hypothetical protein
MAKRFFTTLSLYGILMLAALPLALGWVPPNRWYGFRFPGALFAPEIWYRLNALGGQMFIGGLVVCAVINAAALWLAPKAFQPFLPWLTTGLIAINFWLVTTELVARLPN